jgi:hypothetical protein
VASSLGARIPEKPWNLSGDEQVVVQPPMTEVGRQIPLRQEVPGTNDLDSVLGHELHHVGRRRGRGD